MTDLQGFDNLVGLMRMRIKMENLQGLEDLAG